MKTLLITAAFAMNCGPVTFIETHHPNVAIVKQEIVELDALAKEKATLIAIASIETEHMEVDYPKCDNKQGDSCNLGIYKANVAQLEDLDVDLVRFNQDHLYQHRAMLRGMRKMGRTEFLLRHRGGETIRGPEVDSYVCAIEALTQEYLKRGFEGDTRLTVKINPI